MPPSSTASPPRAPAPQDAGIVEVEAALTKMIRQAARPATWRRMARAAGLGLDRSGYITLARIEEAAASGPVRLTYLAEATGFDISTVSRQVRAVIETGLVERSCDPSDQRAHHLRLTPAGQDTLDRARRASQESLSEMLACWPVKERQTLARLLDRLVAQIAVANHESAGR
jgi:DNA-binding MarR family transcriptional regulator